VCLASHNALDLLLLRDTIIGIREDLIEKKENEPALSIDLT
jgi:hypothetical protein